MGNKLSGFGTHAMGGQGFGNAMGAMSHTPDGGKNLPKKDVREVGGNKGGTTGGGKAAAGDAKMDKVGGKGVSDQGGSSTAGAAKGPAKMDTKGGKGVATGGKGPAVSMPKNHQGLATKQVGSFKGKGGPKAQP